MTSVEEAAVWVTQNASIGGGEFCMSKYFVDQWRKRMEAETKEGTGHF